jgi:hypothetical protein
LISIYRDIDMATTTEGIAATLDDLLSQLPLIEQRSPRSAIEIYGPSDEHARFYHDLCRTYLVAPYLQRVQIADAVRGKPGVLNNLLGYVYEAAQHVRETRGNDWLQIGLAAAAMRGDGPDYRDFFLALAELYVAAEEAGLDPRAEFAAIGGGVPADFHTYAVLKEQQSANTRGTS